MVPETLCMQGDTLHDYLRAHWQGKQSLAWSFWVNLLALRLLLFVVQRFASPAEFEDYSAHRWVVISLVFVVHGMIFCWQVVGTWRAAEQHLRTLGAQSTVWGVQTGLLLCFWLTLVHAWGGWQMTLPLPENDVAITSSTKPLREPLDIAIHANSGDMLISGPIAPGITRQVEQALDATPTVVKRVVLSSQGGDLYEGRGLAKLFRQRALATHVAISCASACTSAYIGGSPRTLAEQARLGFHQYRVDADYLIIATSPEVEQARDQKLFIEAGVSVHFVEKMFDSTASGMWWPDTSELLQSGVVDGVIQVKQHQ